MTTTPIVEHFYVVEDIGTSLIPGSDIGDVGNPRLVRCADSELTLQSIRHQQRRSAEQWSWSLTPRYTAYFVDPH